MQNTIQQETYDHIKEHVHCLKVDISTGEILNRTVKPGGDGYIKVYCKGKTIRGHHVIGFYKFGESMVGKQINHLDGNKVNNHPDNLELTTPAGNLKHAYETGLKRKTKGMPGTPTKLNAEDVLKIRELRKSGEKLLDIAEMFGITNQHVANICKGERWSHIPL